MFAQLTFVLLRHVVVGLAKGNNQHVPVHVVDVLVLSATIVDRSEIINVSDNLSRTVKFPTASSCSSSVVCATPRRL